MARSDKSSVNFECYVLSGEALVPVRLSSDIQLKDLDSFIAEEIQPYVKDDEKHKEQLSSKVVLLLMRNCRDESHVEDSSSFDNISVDSQKQLRSKQTRFQTQRSDESQLSLLPIERSGADLPVRPALSLKGFALYSYMWMTFQWIEPNERNNYNSKIPFVFYKAMRLIVALSLWAIVAFELYNLINGLPALVAHVQTFTAMVAFIHRFLWTFRYVVLHHLGLYFFCTQQEHINDILENSNQISTAQWRKTHRRVNDYMAFAAFFLLLLPLLQKLVPIFIEEAHKIPRTWDATVEIVEFFVLVYSRVVAMPVFFFVLLVVQTHLFELQNFNEQVQQCRTSTRSLFNKYKSMSQRVQNSSKVFQPFLAGLLFLLVIWGTLSVYSSVEMFQKIPPASNRFFGVVVSESLGTLLVFVCETVFLFSLPLYSLGRINSLLKKLIFTVTSVDCEEQRENGFALNSEEKREQFANRLEKYQNYGDAGFKVVGLQITQFKSVWLSLLGPVIAFVGNFLLKEHF